MLKRNKLALSISAAVLGGSLVAPLAVAQQDEALEEITVTGIRGALQSALDTKRDANAVVDAISSEDIGKFPDKNIAESLQRIPGIAINRGFAGEGNEVSIRGVDPELTQTLVNGQFVASTSWFSLSFNKRSFNMDLMPSEVVKSVEVYKSPTASLDEGGVGGTVILHTRKPLEMDPFTVFASAETMTNSLDSGTSPTVNGLVSWKDDSNRFGILTAVSYAETIGRANKAENYWEEGWGASGIANFNQDRERQAFDINAQFAATDELTLGAHYFETSLDAQNTNQNLLVFSTGNTQYSDASSDIASTNGVPLKGTLIGGQAGDDGSPAWQVLNDVNTRSPELKTDLVEFTADYEGDGYRVSGVLGSTSAKGGNGGNVNSGWGIYGEDPRWAVNGGDLSVDFDMTLDEGMVIDFVGADPMQGDWLTSFGASISEVKLWDEETFAQADFELDVEYGAIKTLKAGVKVREHEFGKSQFNFALSEEAAEALAGQTLAGSGFAGDVIDAGGVMGPGSDSSYLGVDGDAVNDFVRANVGEGVFVPTAFGEVTEDINAFYVQADFEGDRYRGNFGVRYVTTDTSSQTFLVNGDSLVAENDYSDVLPSVNFAYDLTDEVIIRTSAAKVMSRPSYGTLNPAIGGINPNANTASAGNTAMNPFRANQFDLGVEYYFAENSYVSAAGFYKDIESFVTSTTVDMMLPEEESELTNMPGFDGIEPYTVSIPVQGAGGYVQGIELSYQQMFGNFGVVANTTIADSEGEAADGSKTKLPGNSDLSYNLTGFYEDDMFSARAAYTYRDEFLAEGTALSGALDTFDGQSYLDLTFTWHASENIDVSLQGVNVLEEITVQRHTVGEQTNRVTTENGARYFLKATYRM
ncbi:TonB-dependent receptor [Microbulbifer elongatus]|uniref:TonB-dependent receptor n=1 Tax=Microbulbifer elongatus TaxID=86173 RepID=UPI001CFD0030|nr:TonB-dependent receptor [Microbulbifer elongatus]